MRKIKEKSKPEQKTEINADTLNFLEMIAPSVMRFNIDHFICGNTYRCVWAIREYPTSTEEQAILHRLGEKDGITLKIYTRHVTALEEKKIIHNASNRNRMRQNTTDLQETITASSNLQDVETIITTMHRNREPLLHTAVYIELTANDMDKLKLLQTEVETELMRSKLNVDKLLMRQKEGFICVMPTGCNIFQKQFERVLPASSVANLYPFAYSGKTDPNGFYLGKDKYGSNILVDFERRESDKTNSNILILGNSGQGKSYLLKLILTCLRESGKNIVCLDPDSEYEELTKNLGGTYIDLMSGEYIINVLEPKLWHDGSQKTTADEDDSPATFKQHSRMSQHISFLRDFFRSYKDFTDAQIDTIEMMLEQLYKDFDISDTTDFSQLVASDYPILSDLYQLCENEFKTYDTKKKKLYTADMLREICLGLHSMCAGAESRFFNGHTNVESHRFITFGCKGLLESSKNLKNALLFNVLSYMSNALLTNGNTVASIDEMYLFLSNYVAVEYIRNFSKRVRKKDSSIILSSQNVEDFLQENIRELTKPLFAIPTHAFLFNAGNTSEKIYMETLQMQKSEFDIIRYPARGSCLYKCGNERYNLLVKAPDYKARLFGNAGGR